MNPASLPAGSAQHPSDGLFQSFVGIANDQSHVAQTPAYQVAQELGPEGTVWSCPDLVDSEQILRREQLINLPGCLEPLLFEVLRAQITQR